MKINILSIREFRWQGSGKITRETLEIFYSEHERGMAIGPDQNMRKRITGH